MRRLRTLSFVALCLGSTAAAAQLPAAADIQLENPRAFGHFIGDRLERHVQISVPRQYVLQQKTLPKAGRASAWIELTAAHVESSSNATRSEYRIDLHYLVVNSPTENRVVTLPAVKVLFAAPDATLEQTIDEWPVALAPLSPGGVRRGLEQLRPAHLPPLIDTTASKVRLASYLVVVMLIATYLILSRYGGPAFTRRNRPFAAAQRVVRSLANQPASEENFRMALQAVHRAFDDTAQVRVFPERLDEFMTHQPRFADLQGLAERFFALSRSEFFAGGASESRELSWLLDLCKQFRARERS